MILLADFVSFSNSVGVGTFVLAGMFAIATFTATRRDKRYEIASGERDEYKKLSESLEGRMRDQAETSTAKLHEAELEITRLNGEVELLKARPDMSSVATLIHAHDDASQANVRTVTEVLASLSRAQEHQAAANKKIFDGLDAVVHHLEALTASLTEAPD